MSAGTKNIVRCRGGFTDLVGGNAIRREREKTTVSRQLALLSSRCHHRQSSTLRAHSRSRQAFLTDKGNRFLKGQPISNWKGEYIWCDNKSHSVEIPCENIKTIVSTGYHSKINTRNLNSILHSSSLKLLIVKKIKKSFK